MVRSPGWPKIFVLTTGGTISERSGARGTAEPGFAPQKLVPESGPLDADLEFREVFEKPGSEMVPGDWPVLAAATAQVLGAGAQGVVILHGTDTMHFTAAALSFMLHGLSVPIVLTGSMLPGGDPGSDSARNVRDALHVAAAADLAEVCVVFSADDKGTRGTIIRGTRARKAHSSALNAFDSVNAPPLGMVYPDKIALAGQDFRRRAPRKVGLAVGLDPNVVLIKLTPAVTGEALTRYLHSASGAVLEGTGIGHVRHDLCDVIERFAKPTVICSQAAHGGERLGVYSRDKVILDLPNVIPGASMTSETALVKLMWALGQEASAESLMRANIAGELDDNESRYPSPL